MVFASRIDIELEEESRRYLHGYYHIENVLILINENIWNIHKVTCIDDVKS